MIKAPYQSIMIDVRFRDGFLLHRADFR